MLGLGVEVQQDAVPQDRGGQGRDILIRDAIPAVRERADLGAQDDELVTASTSTTRRCRSRTVDFALHHEIQLGLKPTSLRGR